MAIIVGSARRDENGKYVNGKAGDSLQKSSTNDTIGEVSMQEFYVHSKGWHILRPKNVDHANAIASRMKAACNNKNIGYDQNDRLGVITYGIDTKTPTDCDCSSLARGCVKEATGKDVGNFTTANEATALENSGLFEKRVKYVSQDKTPVYDGDVLVTCTKGHTVVVVSGNPRVKTTAPVTPTTPATPSGTELKVGDTVMFTGSVHYTSSYTGGVAKPCKSGQATVTSVSKGKPHPYCLKAVPGKGSTVHGWVDIKDIEGATVTEIKVGDTVTFNGNTHYTSSYAGAVGKPCKGGKATVERIVKGRPYPYLLKGATKGCTVYGWVKAEEVSK